MNDNVNASIACATAAAGNTEHKNDEVTTDRSFYIAIEMYRTNVVWKQIGQCQ